ncbi:MAG: patatin-like phospholipase family protein [Acidimicrobiia bacterium]
MKKIGLVLGAGGLTGQAFHAGVLEARAEATGWDPRTASVIVGTSAGAGVGAYLRLGLSGPDLAAMLSTEPLTDEGAELVGRLGPSGDWTTPVGPRSWPKPPHPRLVARAITRPLKIRPEAVLGVTFPPGRVPTESWAGALRALTGTAWPEEPLWICTVRTDDARRVVLGRADAPKTDLATAVAASSAIPGYFQPVEIDGRLYVDGGVHSPTNADVLRKEDLDLVLVSSPMSTSKNAPLMTLSQPMRRHFRYRLSQEVRRLRRRGIPVVVFQPSAADQSAMGGKPMDPERNAAVVRSARETTRRRLEHGRHADHLAVLAA